MKYLLIVAMLFVVGCGPTKTQIENDKQARAILETIEEIHEVMDEAKQEDDTLLQVHPEYDVTIQGDSETILVIGYDGTIDWRGDKGKAIDGFWDAIQTSGMNLYQNGWDAAMKECKGDK